MNLAVSIHRLSSKFPKEEMYGLTSQIRRASLSIPSNIAEGIGRFTYPDKRHKYVQARGELTEVENFFFYAEKIGYINTTTKSKYLGNL